MIRRALLLSAALWVAACGEHDAATADVPVKREPARIQQGIWSGFPEGVPEAFARGVTAANWFTHRSDLRLAPGWPDASDFTRMRKLGLRHVRVLLDPD